MNSHSGLSIILRPLRSVTVSSLNRSLVPRGIGSVSLKEKSRALLLDSSGSVFRSLRPNSSAFEIDKVALIRLDPWTVPVRTPLAVRVSAQKHDVLAPQLL